MIRANKDNTYYVECSHCKAPAGRCSTLEGQAVKYAEEQAGFAVVGKFQFCPSCFSDMLERWKVNNNNKQVLSEVNEVANNTTKESDLNIYNPVVIYEGQMDQEILPLCDALNCIPGVRTCDSCFGHGESAPSIKFQCSNSISFQFILWILEECRNNKDGKTWFLTPLVDNYHDLSGKVGFKQKDCDFLVSRLRKGLKENLHGNY